MGSHTSVFRAWCLHAATLIRDIITFDECLTKTIWEDPKQRAKMVKPKFLEQ